MKKTETKKLFYNKYLYRVQLVTKFGDLFRPKHRKKLEAELVALDIEKNRRSKSRVSKNESFALTGYPWRHRSIFWNDIDLANDILGLLKANDDYKIRVEGHWVSIYSNSESFIDSFVNELPSTCVKEISKPDPKLKDTLVPGKLIVSEKFKNFEYKVHFSYVRDSKLPEWISANNDLFEITPHSQDMLNRGYGVNYMQLYVKDKKALTVLQMRMPSNLLHLYELVHK